jgi:CO dehydrogenase maturation factor
MNEKVNVNNYESIKSKLANKRILFCGKGGSGKSSIVALMAHILEAVGCNILLLDGDASNPGGLIRLMFGLNSGPKPLIEYFGGREKVGCPVDDPDPLTREGDSVPLTEKHIDINEIPAEYYVEKGKIILFQAGKINRPFEGCDGPMSKIIRDFIVADRYTTLIDVEAGIEHYGRGIEQNVDAVITIVDQTYESLLIAEKVKYMCEEMNIDNFWAVINKTRTQEDKIFLSNKLEKIGMPILGVVHEDKKWKEPDWKALHWKPQIVIETY